MPIEPIDDGEKACINVDHSMAKATTEYEERFSCPRSEKKDDDASQDKLSRPSSTCSAMGL